MRAAISEKRTTTYANIEFSPFHGCSEGTNIFCSRRLCNPCIWCTLGHVSWSRQNSCPSTYLIDFSSISTSGGNAPLLSMSCNIQCRSALNGHSPKQCTYSLAIMVSFTSGLWRSPLSDTWTDHNVLLFSVIAISTFSGYQSSSMQPHLTQNVWKLQWQRKLACLSMSVDSWGFLLICIHASLMRDQA